MAQITENFLQKQIYFEYNRIGIATGAVEETSKKHRVG
jgi:hypothetical protein